jgi:ABC-2 type transport system permease protein
MVMYRRALREALRVSIATIVIPLVLPLFMLTIFAQVFSSVTSIGAFGGRGAYVQYIAPAAVLMGAMLGSSTTGISSAMEIQTGFMDRIRISVLSLTRNLMIRRFADATRLAAFAVVLIVAAWMCGAHIANWPLGIAIAVLGAALWGVAYGGLTLSVCLRTGSIETAQGLVPIFFPILFMSTSLVPLSLLPAWLQTVAEWNPVSYICDVMRLAAEGKVEGDPTIKAVIGIAAVAVITQTLVWRARRRLVRE